MARDHPSGGIVRCGEQEELRPIPLEEARQGFEHGGLVLEPTPAPGIHHRQAPELDAFLGECQLRRVIGVRGVEQDDPVSRVQQRDEQRVRQTRRALSDQEMLVGQAGCSIECAVEPEKRGAQVREPTRRGVRTELVEEGGVTAKPGVFRTEPVG